MHYSIGKPIEHKPGKWRCYVTIAGRRRWAPLSKSPAEATEAAERMAQIAASGPLTVDETIDSYLEHLRAGGARERYGVEPDLSAYGKALEAEPGDIMARDTYVCPPAWTEEEIPANKLETFREFVGSYYSYTAVKHGYKPNLKGDQKYGYMLLDEQGEVMKVIDRTNPNAKWDWYQVGGRYLGRLLVKPNARGRVGKSGAFSNKPLHQDGVDSCRWGDVDLDRMRDEAEARAAADYDSIAAVVKGRTFKSWPEVRREFGCLDGDHVNWPEGAMEKARDAYHEQEVIKELSSHKDLFRWDGYEEYRQPREEFLAKARERALSSFAVITEDGKWYERGEMGWWGIVRDEKDVDTWDREFAKLLDNLTPDHYVTYVDCHI